MSSIRSNYLNKDFQVDLFEKLDETSGSALKIISHASLEDIVINQLNDVLYDYEIVKAEKEHSVVKCIMSDKKGRRVVEIGESTIATLSSEIGLSYPVLTASQRAFDRATISFLNIPGKVYSDLEIQENQENTPESTEKKPGPKAGKINSKKEESPAETPKSAEIKAQTEAKEEIEVKDPGQAKIVKGRAKGKTIAETFENDISSIAWVRKTLGNSTNPEIVEMLRNIEDYMLLNPEAQAALESFLAA